MSSRGYKPGELFRRTMLARVTNPSWNDTECQEDSQGNSLAAGVEQVSDDICSICVKCYARAMI